MIAGTTAHPARLTKTLERLSLADLLADFVAPGRVRRWGFLAIERFTAPYGYEFRRRDGNVYGAVIVQVELAYKGAMRVGIA